MLGIRELTNDEMAVVVGGAGGGMPATQPNGNQYYCARISGDGSPNEYAVIIYNVNTGVTTELTAKLNLCDLNHGAITANDFLTPDEAKAALGPGYLSHIEYNLSDFENNANKIVDDSIQKALDNLAMPKVVIHNTSGLHDDGPGTGSHSSSSRGNVPLMAHSSGSSSSGKVGQVTIEEVDK